MSSSFDFDLDKDPDKKPSKSADQAVADIEAKVRELNAVDNIQANIIKDPSSRFITAQDVQMTQALYNLGIVKTISARKNKVMGSSLLKSDPDTVRKMMLNTRQPCPVCSVETHSLFQMEYIEDAGIFHCVRCQMTIDPFEANEPLPEAEPTSFGLTAIHDMNPLHTRKRGKPLVSQRKKVKSTYDKLADTRKSDALDSQLKKFGGRKK